MTNRKELWIDRGEEWSYGDDKPLYTKNGIEKTAFHMPVTLEGADLASYEEYLRLQEYWQSTFRDMYSTWSKDR